MPDGNVDFLAVRHIEIFDRNLYWARRAKLSAMTEYRRAEQTRCYQECYRQIAHIMVYDLSKGAELLLMLDKELCY